MKKIIKNSLFSFALLFSVFAQADIVDYSQNIANGVNPGVVLYIDQGLNYNQQLNSPLKFNDQSNTDNPIALNVDRDGDGKIDIPEFELGEDIWLANQYSLNSLTEEDLGTSCGTDCTEVLDWRYVFTLLDDDGNSTGTTIKGYYNNAKKGNIVFDWETIHKAQLDPFSSAINFASGGENTTLFTTGKLITTWTGQTFIENIKSTKVIFTILDTSLLPGISTLAAPQKLFLSAQSLDIPPAQADSVPEPGSLLLLGLGFILLGRRIFK